MKRASHLLSSIVLGFAILGGCATAPDPMAVEQARLAAFAKLETQAEYDIRALLDEQAKAWNSGDIDGYMDSYLKSEKLRFASQSDIVWGFSDTREVFKSQAGMGKLSTEIQEIKLFTEKDATVFGRWYQAGGSVGEIGGLFTLVLEKRLGQWTIVSEHNS